jgi:GT2 family glycosyltransferase
MLQRRYMRGACAAPRRDGERDEHMDNGDGFAPRLRDRGYGSRMSHDVAVKSAGATRLRSPVRVEIIDIADTLRDLDCMRSATPPYTGVWILVCRSGRPLGSVEIPLTGVVITAAELEHEFRLQLCDAGNREVLDNDAVPLVRASVIVPSNFARPAQLQRCVEHLNQLNYPDYEVIVVDNRPGNVPRPEVSGARVVREPRPGISAARNRGIAVATGEIIAFTDDDVVVDRRWLRALGERFARQPDVSAVTGLVVPLELETSAQVLFEQSGSGLDRGFVPLTFERAGPFRVLRRAAWSGTENIHSVYLTGEFGLGSNMAFRTSVLRAVGGFDEALGVGTPARGGEDLAMLIKLLSAGHQLAYEPSAIIQHSHRATLAELERQIHGYGVGFTAMLTAVTLRNPRHVIGLAAVIPAWLQSLRDPSSAKNVHRQEDFPRALARAELRGLLTGPFAYLRSRRIQRRLR